MSVDGIDMELSFRFNREDRFVVSYALMKVSGTNAATDATINQRNRLESVPDYSGSLFLMHRFNPDWSGSLGYYFVDEMLWLSDGDKLPFYRRTDLRLARIIRAGDTRGEMSLIIQNLGSKYADFTEQQFFDTKVYLSGELSF